MKTLRALMFGCLALMVSLSVAFVSCSDDDDDDGGAVVSDPITIAALATSGTVGTQITATVTKPEGGKDCTYQWYTLNAGETEVPAIADLATKANTVSGATEAKITPASAGKYFVVVTLGDDKKASTLCEVKASEAPADVTPSDVTRVTNTETFKQVFTEDVVKNHEGVVGTLDLSGCTNLASLDDGSADTPVIPGFGKTGAEGNQLKINKLILPDSLTKIPQYFAKGATGIKEIQLGGAVTEIADYAFVSCTSIESISIPATVTKIGKEAFNGCTSLTTVTFAKNSSNTTAIATIDEGAFANCTALTTAPTIPVTVTKLSKDLFRGCKNLASATIPSSVTEIADGAFKDCTALAAITIPTQVTKVGKVSTTAGTPSTGSTTEADDPTDTPNAAVGVFAGCTKLTEVTIGSAVTTLGDETFRNCTELVSVTIPAAVTTLGAAVFRGCTSLTDVTFSGNPTTIGKAAFMDCTAMTTCQIPTGATAIQDEAFKGCKALTEVVIPTTVTSIGKMAFKDCEGVTKLTFTGTSSCTTISEQAFVGCKKLGEIAAPAAAAQGKAARADTTAGSGTTTEVISTFPASVTTIGKEAFKDCQALVKITIPATVTTMGEAVFRYIGLGKGDTVGITVSWASGGKPSGWDAKWADWFVAGSQGKEPADTATWTQHNITYNGGQSQS